VVSLAVLADDNPPWRPSQHRVEALGCEHVMRFPVAKLLDFEPALHCLPQQANPFALVKAAHLMALRTRTDADRRLAAKLQLVRQLYRQGWQTQRVINLFAMLDWMLRLPESLEQPVWQDVVSIERSADMKYVTGVEGRSMDQDEQVVQVFARLEQLRRGVVLESALKTISRQGLDCSCRIHDPDGHQPPRRLARDRAHAE
jgi:hypothetical protein